MKNHIVEKSTRHALAFKRVYICVLMISLTISVTTLNAQAAYIDFNPSSVDVTMDPGETKSVNVSYTVKDVSSSVFFAAFLLQDATNWASSRLPSIVFKADQTQSSTIVIRVPESAALGTYQLNVEATKVTSTEPLAKSTFPIYLTVGSTQVCSQAPELTSVNGDNLVIRARNNKPMTFNFSGAFDMPTNCVNNQAFIKLIDEYGEPASSNQLEVDKNGNFEASVTVETSRKGNDKDGRLYEVLFWGENEFGQSNIKARTIKISHDNRKVK